MLEVKLEQVTLETLPQTAIQIGILKILTTPNRVIVIS